VQRDWARQETAPGFTQILLGDRFLLGDRWSLAGTSTEPAHR
jgi:hypothetical protein